MVRSLTKPLVERVWGVGCGVWGKNVQPEKPDGVTSNLKIKQGVGCAVRRVWGVGGRDSPHTLPPTPALGALHLIRGREKHRGDSSLYSCPL